VHLFGYDLTLSFERADRHFNEIRNTNLERNHVVFVAILFSCQGTDVRERAAILPDPHGRVKRIGFSVDEANPFDADTPTTRICYWERSAEEVLRLPLAGTGDCMFPPALCQLPQVGLTTP
jgi:hypothetical protein